MSFLPHGSKHPFAEDYELGKELGSGHFAVVKVAKNKKTHEECAVKIIEKGHVDVRKEAVWNEIDIMTRIRHPNLVELRGMYEDKKKVYLVLEYLRGGELFDRIVERYPSGYSERVACGLMRKLLSALEYMHSRGIVHRDLKPENILFDGPSDAAEIKISDFGLSKIATEDSLLRTSCGTPEYIAPEVLLDTGYDAAVDMWAIGVILYILLCGFPPFGSDSPEELFDQIMQGDYSFPSPWWDKVSTSAKDLVTRMLTIFPTKRITAKQALSHPWIKGITAHRESMPDIIPKLKEFLARRMLKKGMEAVHLLVHWRKLTKK